MLRGMRCTPELVKAVELRYTIVRFHEVWHFPPTQRKRSLFADYVNQCLKIKQECAGYPSWARTDEDKARYVREYHESEGISLDLTMIQKNAARKATAKLMLSSFCGKFGESLNKPLAIETPAELFGVVFDPLVHFHTLRVYTEDRMKIVYSNISENQPNNGKPTSSWQPSPLAMLISNRTSPWKR